jgi:hypothetical protein
MRNRYTHTQTHTHTQKKKKKNKKNSREKKYTKFTETYIINKYKRSKEMTMIHSNPIAGRGLSEIQVVIFWKCERLMQHLRVGL